jgi:hypothetical protein
VTQKNVDVVVAGGGTSGFAAAIAAARNGARVCLIERSTALGGTMTNGLVPGINSMRHQPCRTVPVGLSTASHESNFSGKQYIKGIAQELVDRLLKLKAVYAHEGESPVRVNFDHETMKLVMDQMVREAGAEILYLSEVTGVIKDGDILKGVVLSDGGVIHAKTVIDTTGDANVVALAGAPWEQGRHNVHNHTQAASLYFLIGDVDLDKMIAGMDPYPTDFPDVYREMLHRLWGEKKPFAMLSFPTLMRKAIENGDYPPPCGTSQTAERGFAGLIRPIYRNGKIRNTTMHNVDMAHMCDPTNIPEFSKTISAMREFVVKYAEYLRKYIPGYGDSYLLSTAHQIGIRESRIIIGEYKMTGEDTLEGREFLDAIGWCGHAVDVHDDNGSRDLEIHEVGGSGAYQIPYRILVPQRIDGLLVAGRTVSSDITANGTLRGQASCILMGQAAGTAAALAAKAGVAPRRVDVAHLQKQLKADGVVL